MNSRQMLIIAGLVSILLGVAVASAEIYPAWIKNYAGQPINGDSQGTDIILDESGDVYVTGQSMLDDHLDVVTIKYNPDGTPAWTTRYRPEGYIHSWARGMDRDEAGNIYVIADVRSAESNNDAELIRYSAATGEIDWVRIYDNPSQGNDFARSITVDPAGDIYFGSNADADLMLFKYHADGSLAWQREYSDPLGSTLTGRQLTTDGSGNVYMVAFAHDGRSVVLKYSPEGEVLLSQILSSPDFETFLIRIAVTDDGEIYVAGYSYPPETRYDWLVWKLNAAGETDWTFTYHGDATWVGDMYDIVDAIALDDAGNLFVTGIVGFQSTKSDIVTMKFLPDGTVVWNQRQDGGLGLYDDPDHLCLDDAGNIYVAGGTQGSNKNGCDFLLLKYDNDGVFKWARRYTSASANNNFAVRVVADAGQNVYVTGFTQPLGDASDVYTTIKYVPSPVELGDVNANGAIDAGDAVALINYIFRQGPGSDPVEISDSNCDSAVNVGDIVYLIGYIFREGPPCDCLH
jgi:uncharacterized delta-60 repeat protein